MFGEAAEHITIVGWALFALKKAREQFLAGKTHAAEETWRSIIKLHDGKTEFADEVAKARAGRARWLIERRTVTTER